MIRFTGSTASTDTGNLDVLLTVQDYAALVGLHPSSVYRAIQKGAFHRPLVRDAAGVLIRVPAAFVKGKSKVA